MPVRSDEPLRKVTLNLYESDCQWLEQEYGHGWSERLRQHVHNDVMKRHHMHYDKIKPRRTLGDLADDR